ncbi:hypothetical protein BZA05DRAFT_12501 [Tricharina praecox]|uniref:uncharacterized protein n=1 Tax=Tricharina praecox TaxID=43433 RepID=UPI00221EA5F3|nr:uncharacterized protein BZA05DRAFT_12501 [Tricharina praecox]KAI5858750.1 hypothetical protein BZA05DRAFT_12501 [Tricharina praecox]
MKRITKLGGYVLVFAAVYLFLMSFVRASQVVWFILFSFFVLVSFRFHRGWCFFLFLFVFFSSFSFSSSLQLCVRVPSPSSSSSPCVHPLHAPAFSFPFRVIPIPFSFLSFPFHSLSSFFNHGGEDFIFNFYLT